MAPTPLALPPALPSELLTWILTHQAYPTTLIICQPRATFLTSLLNSIPQSILPQPPPLPVEDDTSSAPPDPNPSPPHRHPLLIPTLHQIATSRHISLVFIPTISHLRAYLSVFPPPTDKEPSPEQVFEKPGKNRPLLVVYGMVELHRDTSEWSAQGLGNTLAGLVEAGWRSGRGIVLLEERGLHDEDRAYDGVGQLEQDELGENEAEERRKKRLPKVWDERLPMLNGSARRTGLESEDGGWSGRTVEVGRILSRWFKFGKGDWET